ncbi:MAG: putative O-glycosylation ligase, exosortase A system-associated [Halioglobus sp.]|nr:putative O-glycosylation ligase, exosortase A system-associated [Halioglobus sp.]
MLVFSLLPFILRNAWYGVLAWSWLSYMNPHRLAWGFATTMPFAQIVAIVLLFSMLMNTERKVLPSNSLVVVWGLFLFWNVVCTVFAIYPEFAFEQLEQVLKIQLITFVTLVLMTNLQRINQLIWVIVFSIGFYSVKGGVFTFLTGGAFHVYGPPGSYIMENNTLAVAVLMIIPMMIYLYRFPPHALVKSVMPLCIFFSLAAVVGSQSRGALVAIAAVGAFFWWQSKAKVLTGIVFAFLAFFAVIFMPQEWHDRMATITEYEEDASAMQRLKAWEYSINLANHRFTGGGFNNWSMENYRIYAPGAKKAFVAHSIYFGVLGESGWLGLGLFLAVLFLVWRQLNRVIADCRDDPDREDLAFLARMLKISMIAFMAGGLFLSMAYFDLAWHIMAITVAMTQLCRSKMAEDLGQVKPGRQPRRPSYRRRKPGAVGRM